jgi:ribose transport system ATP-binding protein
VPGTDPSAAPRLEGRGLTKRFPGVLALDRVDLSVSPGEVLAVIGENGAGKSTLMKILAGVERPDAGEIRVEGRPAAFGSVREAVARGIVLIHQELNLSDNLDVAANIFLGREPRRWGFIDRARLRAGAREALEEIGLDVPPEALVGTLPPGRRQMVEIARALSVRANVLIMDEPTSSLSRREAGRLFEVIRGLRARGVSVVYISHRLGEVREIADRVVALRDGRNSGELARADASHEAMIRLMVGRDLSQFYARTSRTAGVAVLEVRDLRTAAHARHAVSFDVRAGERVGIAGLVGAGRTEVLQALFGAVPAVSGSIRVSGREARIRRPIDAIRTGMGLVPEDRKQQGLILEMAVRENLGLAGLVLGGALLDRGRERREAREMIQRLAIRTPGDGQAVQYLSGGNQQKVALGKWLSLRPRVLLLDEPTRGVDVGAKGEIYRLMERLAEQGVAILFVSSDMEEVLGMSDRALVMHEGRLAGELSGDALTEEGVMRLATGRDAAVA